MKFHKEKQSRGWNIVRLHLPMVIPPLMIAFKGDTIRIRCANDMTALKATECKFERKQANDNITQDIFAEMDTPLIDPELSDSICKCGGKFRIIGGDDIGASRMTVIQAVCTHCDKHFNGNDYDIKTKKEMKILINNWMSGHTNE